MHREWIDARLAEGNTNALELHRQLTAMGFRGSYGSVRRYVTKRLGAAGKTRERSQRGRASACTSTVREAIVLRVGSPT